MRIVLAALLVAGCAVPGVASPTTLRSDDESRAEAQSHRELVARMRGWLAEVAELERRFTGSVEITGSSLGEMAKVDWILAQSPYPRRFLHHHDHNFVFSAVKGQDQVELERNLSAIYHYVRLANASRSYWWKARQRDPLIGDRAGIDTVRTIAKRVYDFREAQIAGIKEGSVRPSRVLTVENLGDLGRPELLAELTEAYDAGERQFEGQRNSVVFVLLGLELALSFGIAVVFLQRRRPLIAIDTDAPGRVRVRAAKL